MTTYSETSPETGESDTDAEPNQINSLKESSGSYYKLTEILYSFTLEYRNSKSGLELNAELNSFKEYSHFLPLTRILFRVERFRVWDHINTVKAASVPEIERETSTSQSVVWRTLQDLKRFNLVREARYVPHPRHAGHETIIYALTDATEKDIIMAEKRVPPSLGLRVEKVNVEEKVWAHLKGEHIPLSRAEIVPIIAEKFPEVIPRDRGPMAGRIASRMSRQRGEHID